MKFNEMCKYVLTEKYDDKFIAISPNAKEIVVPPEAIEKLARKPQVNIKELGPIFVKKLANELAAELPQADEIERDDPATQFSKDDVMERIARKVAIVFEVKHTKAKQAALQLFRRFVENGILLAIKFADVKKIDKEKEDERLMKSLEDPESDWMGSGTAGFGGGIEGLTGGFGPTVDDWG